MVDLAVITAWTHSGSILWRISLGLRKKNKNVICHPKSVRIGKNCALCLGYSFSQYGPPSWWISYMYSLLRLMGCLNWSVPFKFCFFGEKTRFTRAIAVNKQANFHNFKIKNLNLLTITFPAIYLLNRSKSLYINQWWEWIILSVRSLTAFEENIVVTVLAKLSLFQSLLEAF